MLCCTIGKGKHLDVQVPKAITIYINQHVWNMSTDTYKPAHPPIDLLPLFNLRMLRSDMQCLFEPDDTVDQYLAHNFGPSSPTYRDAHGEVATAVRDLGELMVFDSAKWRACRQEKELHKILLHPWQPGMFPKVELVFREQPRDGIKIGEEETRCYLPDLRRFGLEDIYYRTVLYFTMSVGASAFPVSGVE
jgi:hypothetical protein